MVEIAEAKRWTKLRQWSEMINTRSESGQTIKDWCKDNGISIKTYYYRLRSLRLAALQEPENAAIYLPGPNASSPTFAKLNFSYAKEVGSIIAADKNAISALTVHWGDFSIDINNGADPNVIANTLRLIRELC